MGKIADRNDNFRSILGPDLVFVVMDMDIEDVRKRVATRHGGHEGAVEMMTVNFLLIFNDIFLTFHVIFIRSLFFKVNTFVSMF